MVTKYERALAKWPDPPPPRPFGHRQKPASTPVFAVEESQGRKLGPVSATYVSQQSCPTSCPFLGAGCYAENGFVGGFLTKRLNAYGETDPIAIAAAEVEKIDRLSGDRPLRLHVVGDSPTIEGTRMLAAAAERYTARGGQKVWTYTHAWRAVPREAWGEISVLASCESLVDVARARMRGYAAALTVEAHSTGRRATMIGPGHHVDVLACPEQTRGVACSDCRLCMDDRRLFNAGLVIAFALHGSPGSLSAARKAIGR